MTLSNTKDYLAALEDIKARIKTTHYKAALGANKELMDLYWSIGNIIIANTKYGARFLENLSRDISLEFPDVRGFAVSNMKYMRKFAEVYPDFQKSQQGVGFLPWRNNLPLMSKIKDDTERQWYIQQNLENGWNNNVLVHQIETKLYQRQALPEKTTNQYRKGKP